MPDGHLTPGDAAAREPAAGRLAAESEALWRLADLLIPATDRMPAASSAEGSREWLDYVLTVRRDLLPAVRRVAARVSEDGPAVVLRDLRGNDPGFFLSVAAAVIGAYYMNPVVGKLIGYPGQEPMLASPAEDGLGDDILGCVASRGARYRQAPAEPTYGGSEDELCSDCIFILAATADRTGRA